MVRGGDWITRALEMGFDECSGCCGRASLPLTRQTNRWSLIKDNPFYMVHNCKCGRLCFSVYLDRVRRDCRNHPLAGWLAGWLAGRPAVAETKRTTGGVGGGGGGDPENIRNLFNVTGLRPL